MKKIKSILLAVLTMTCTALVLLFLASVIIAKVGTLPDRFAAVLGVLIACLSAFLGAWLLTSRVREQGLLYGFCSAAVFAFLLLMVSLLIYHNSIGFSTFWKLCAILLGGSLGGILGVNRKSKVKF